MDKKKNNNKKKKNKAQNKVSENVAAVVVPKPIASDNVTAVLAEPENAAAAVAEPIDRNGESSNAPLVDDTVGETKEIHIGNDAKQVILEEKIKVFQKETDLQREMQASLEAKVEQLLKENTMISQKEASLEAEYQQLLTDKNAYEKKETTLEEKIQKLHVERAGEMQKGASLEEEVRQIQKEKETLMQKGDELEMRILQLDGDKQSWLRKENDLDMTIMQLQTEKKLWLIKENELEMTISQLQSDKQSWLTKEASFEEKIKQLKDEVSTLSLKGGQFKEEVKQIKEERASLRHKEVLDLEAAKNSLSEENNILKENISSLQLRIENLEKAAGSPISLTRTQLHTSENGDIGPAEDSLELVDKLIKEKAELVEKVNELSAELAKRGVTDKESSIVNLQSDSKSAESANMHASGQEAGLMVETNERIPTSSREIHPLEVVGINSGSAGDNSSANFSAVHPDFPEIIASNEIAQIPLVENGNPYMSSNDNLNEERTPLTDAPLIGAPFRFISFFARYVSGADLVSRDAPSN